MQLLSKAAAILSLIVLLSFTSCTSSNYPTSTEQQEEYAEVSGLNNRKLEKNIDKYAAEIGLSKRQVKSLKKIDRRYAKKTRKLRSKGTAKRKDLRNLQEAKREEMLSVLTNQQQKKLQELTKTKKFNFFGLFE